MENSPLDEDFWNTRWQEGATGWDIGIASPAIIDFAEKHFEFSDEVLIPGCGNAYEAERLYALGFKRITLIDIAPALVERLQKKFEKTPEIRVICDDFFNHQGAYDWVIEQTFFCALAPEMRPKYVEKTIELLKPTGGLVGLLFNKEFDKQRPPFGGRVEEYERLFSPCFSIEKMEVCSLSISPRAGSEVFIWFKKINK